MKKSLMFIALSLLVLCNANAVVIQGETTPGVYTNAAVDSSGNLSVTGTVTSSISFPAQGSTTASQTGPLVQGAVTTSAPSYTTAKTNPLSLTTSGLLRVDGSGVTQPISGSLTTLSTLTTITNPVAVTGTFWQATQPISGTVTATGSGNFTVVQPTGTSLHAVLDTTSTTAVTQATGTNLHTVVDSGTITAVTAITNALPSGTNVIGHVINDAGTAIIGKVGIDQTTPGTTDAVTTKPQVGSLTDCSGSITSGGVAQTMAASNASRKYLFIQNTSDTTMWINFTTTAVANQPSIQITAGSAFSMESSYVSTELISVIGATTGKVFTCKQF